ncbi:sigma-70 family RNA polymerase sigma factor [Eggerthellaceae bacterium zg-886]|uniref:Sigma-70 family RNA polymerase sigma factor n=2 Tax=Xiamenia xianingshaonis TaxID=2682776 RepID=A0ABX0ING3_9ACTN|nr:sigma-70 family RNA polymerase sigma factor [Xiamenia xianingshaonis]
MHAKTKLAPETRQCATPPRHWQCQRHLCQLRPRASRNGTCVIIPKSATFLQHIRPGKRIQGRKEAPMLPRKRQADANSLEAAIDRFGDTVLRLAMSRLRNKADAEDVFQNVFLALHRSAPDFASAEHQKAWLLRTTCNACNDLARHRSRRMAAPLEGIDVADAAAPDESTEAFDAALAALTEAQRTAVHLYYYEGYSAAEIGRITDENPTTVRSHLMRARKAMRLSLERSDTAPHSPSSALTRKAADL